MSGPQQRLAAGQDEHRHLEALEVVHHRIDLLGPQLAGKIGVGRNRIAMLAGQVAAPDQVPDDHRAGRIALGAERRRRGDFLHVLGDAKHGFPCSRLRRIQRQPPVQSIDVSQSREECRGDAGGATLALYSHDDSDRPKRRRQRTGTAQPLGCRSRGSASGRRKEPRPGSKSTSTRDCISLPAW